MGAGEARQGPITALAHILLSARPPHLSAVVLLLEDIEAVREFHELVGQYLPDQQEQVLTAGGLQEQVGAFALAFRERYFPLDSRFEDGDLESLSELLVGIPIEVEGWSWDDYHDLPDNSLSAILSSLLVNFETEVGLEGEGIRVTMMEAAARTMSVELLDRLPFQGYSLELLQQSLPATRYEGVLLHALMLCHQTQNTFLDTTTEEVYEGGFPEWNQKNVDSFTQEWAAAEEVWGRVKDFYTWLEEDPQGHFSELLNFLEWDLKGTPPAAQLLLPLELLEY